MVRDAQLTCYAPGGGLGHLTRSIAVLRQVQRRVTPDVMALTNSPSAHLYETEGIPHLRIFGDETGTSRDPVSEVREAVARRPPDVLVVDAFPRGILGELPDVLPQLPCPKMLILRRLRDEYVLEYDVVSFVRSHYDAVLCIEPFGGRLREGLGDRAKLVPPVLIRDADELLPPPAARERLGVSAGDRLVLGVGSGPPEHVARFFRLLVKIHSHLAQPAALRLAAPGPPSTEWEPFRLDYYPLFELLRGVDLVVGAGGYNLFHECRAAGVPSVFVPQTRLYDDQFARAEGSLVADGPEELAHHIRSALASAGPERPPPVFHNGAADIAQAIGTLLSAGS